VKGRIDRIEAAFIARAMATAVRDGSQVLIIQLNSPGSVLSDRQLAALAERVRRSPVPVAVWVGPSGAAASGDAVRLLEAAAIAGRANGATVRGAEVDTVTPTIGDFIVGLDGDRFETAEVVERNGQPRREPTAPVRFAKLDLSGRVLHATTNPWLAYTLLVFGWLLIVFEFYSVGVGLAGLTGALSLALAAYGLAALGASSVGLALIAVAVFGYAVDVQAGAPRVWTVVGSACLALGSVILYPAGLRPAWWTILAVLALAVLFTLRGMPVMVRARFSTSSIGRESLIGAPAEAATAIASDGTVRARGALWRARVKGAGAIEAGDGVRVVSIDGLVLEVEPAEGRSGTESSGAG